MVDHAPRWALLVAGLAISATLHGPFDTLVPRSPLWGVVVEAVTSFLLLAYLLKAGSPRQPSGLLEAPPLPAAGGPRIAS